MKFILKSFPEERKIEVIKILRLAGPMSLRRAKEIIEQLLPFDLEELDWCAPNTNKRAKPTLAQLCNMVGLLHEIGCEFEQE